MYSSVPDVTVRRASLADISHILRHRRAMFEEMGHNDKGVLDQMETDSECYLRTAMASGAYVGWLMALTNGRAIAGGGVVISHWPGFPGEHQPRRAWILNVYTDPDYRRRGIAKQITETILEWCRAEGFTSVYLHASKFGRPLYESLGFVPTNEMRLGLK